MIILPAIDLIGGQAVRLLHGDYSKLTVYDTDPVAVAKRFESSGAKWLHVVDLEGARDGGTPNIETVSAIVRETSLNVEIGGGIRSLAVAEKYLSVGVKRVILGTVAVTEPEVLDEILREYKGSVVLGVDLRGESVAIKGWLEEAPLRRDEFFALMIEKGVRDFIVTDISRDGAMRGTNVELYRALTEKYRGCNFVASGGVSSYADIEALTRVDGLWGAIVGRACYTGDIEVEKAIKLAQGGGV